MAVQWKDWRIVQREFSAKGAPWADLPPKLVANKVFLRDWDLPDPSMGDEQFFKMQQLFAIADAANVGYLGRNQFKGLLDVLEVDYEKAGEEDQLEKMFVDMDADGNGQIEFDEFLAVMWDSLDADQLEAANSVKAGAMGTSSWKRGEIVWCANCNIIIAVMGMTIALVVVFEFILVPLTTAYFFVFLAAPFMNFFEFRPIECGGKKICDPFDEDKNYKSAARAQADGTPKASLIDCFTLGQMPHGLACLAVIFGAFGVLFAIIYMIYLNVKDFSDDPKFQQDIDDYIDDIYSDLNDSGMKIVTEEKDGYSMAELMGYVNIFSGFLNQSVLVLLLFSYLLAEKINPFVFDPQNEVFYEIEGQVMYYIVLKTAISLLTGIVVGIILLICSVKLAIMFGMLSFLLNFIPNIGSMIAIVLPIPIVLVDKALASWQVAGALIGPSIVQFYIGNALEPVLFGKSLNMTPLSILAALVIWGSIWGIMGAVFSVPLLSVQKVVLQHCNHPMAKYIVMMVREDPTIDEMAEQRGADDGGDDEDGGGGDDSRDGDENDTGDTMGGGMGGRD